MPKRAERRRNRLADYTVYLCVRIATTLARSVHYDHAYGAARFLGTLFYYVSRRHRVRSIEHIKRSFPGWPESKCRDVARKSMSNMMYLGVEFMFIQDLITPRRWRRHIRLSNMRETIEFLIKRDRGLIFLTGHFGNWEIIGYTMASIGFPITAVARHLDNPYLNKYILGLREKRGLRILDKKGATEAIPRMLADNGRVGFIADQDAGKKGVFVDFFGRKASTYKSIALLAMEYRIPVIVGYGKRLGDSFNFEIGIEKIIYPADWRDKDNPRDYITREYTAALENRIRKSPHQYLWVHRRWKHRPDGTRAVPDGIA